MRFPGAQCLAREHREKGFDQPGGTMTMNATLTPSEAVARRKQVEDER